MIRILYLAVSLILAGACAHGDDEPQHEETEEIRTEMEESSEHMDVSDDDQGYSVIGEDNILQEDEPIGEEDQDEDKYLVEASSAAPPIEPKSAINSFVYVVTSGDSLSRIAKRVYGKLADWKKIAAQNPQITDPNKIFPGMELTIHVAAGQSTEFGDAYQNVKASSKMSITVSSGDTLSKLSVKYLKHGANWKVLWLQNRSTVKNPDLIYKGQKLQVSPGILDFSPGTYTSTATSNR